MAHYQLVTNLKLPTTTPVIWDYIATPKNLKDITPKYMNFTITSKTSLDKMYAGMIIAYEVSPMLGIPLQWVTEITHIKEYEYFVDEQRIGPYAMWHHEHFIEAIHGGISMTDIVTYKPPGGIFGVIANHFIIQKQLAKIFDYRRVALENLFGKYEL